MKMDYSLNMRGKNIARAAFILLGIAIVAIIFILSSQPSLMYDKASDTDIGAKRGGGDLYTLADRGRLGGYFSKFEVTHNVTFETWTAFCVDPFVDFNPQYPDYVPGVISDEKKELLKYITNFTYPVYTLAEIDYIWGTKKITESEAYDATQLIIWYIITDGTQNTPPGLLSPNSQKLFDMLQDLYYSYIQNVPYYPLHETFSLRVEEEYGAAVTSVDDTYDRYGPFRLYLETNNVSLDSQLVMNIIAYGSEYTIVDSSGVAITQITSNDDFYIKYNKFEGLDANLYFELDGDGWKTTAEFIVLESVLGKHLAQSIGFPVAKPRDCTECNLSVVIKPKKPTVNITFNKVSDGAGDGNFNFDLYENVSADVGEGIIVNGTLAKSFQIIAGENSGALTLYKNEQYFLVEKWAAGVTVDSNDIETTKTSSMNAGTIYYRPVSGYDTSPLSGWTTTKPISGEYYTGWLFTTNATGSYTVTNQLRDKYIGELEPVYRNIYERTIQDFYQRTSQKFYKRGTIEYLERPVQEFFERELQNIYERTIWEFYERTIQYFVEISEFNAKLQKDFSADPAYGEPQSFSYKIYEMDPTDRVTTKLLYDGTVFEDEFFEETSGLIVEEWVNYYNSAFDYRETTNDILPMLYISKEDYEAKNFTKWSSVRPVSGEYYVGIVYHTFESIIESIEKVIGNYELVHTIPGEYEFVERITSDYQLVRTERGDYEVVATVQGDYELFNTEYGDYVFIDRIIDNYVLVEREFLGYGVPQLPDIYRNKNLDDVYTTGSLDPVYQDDNESIERIETDIILPGCYTDNYLDPIYREITIEDKTDIQIEDCINVTTKEDTTIAVKNKEVNRNSERVEVEFNKLHVLRIDLLDDYWTHEGLEITYNFELYEKDSGKKIAEFSLVSNKETSVHSEMLMPGTSYILIETNGNSDTTVSGWLAGGNKGDYTSKVVTYKGKPGIEFTVGGSTNKYNCIIANSEYKLLDYKDIMISKNWLTGADSEVRIAFYGFDNNTPKHNIIEAYGTPNYLTNLLAYLIYDADNFGRAWDYFFEEDYSFNDYMLVELEPYKINANGSRTKTQWNFNGTVYESSYIKCDTNGVPQRFEGAYKTLNYSQLTKEHTDGTWFPVMIINYEMLTKAVNDIIVINSNDNNFGTLNVFKHDRKNSKESLPGAEFEIYRLIAEPDTFELYDTFTTTNVMTTLESLPVGTYKLIETKAPDKFIIGADNEYIVVITAGEVKTIHIFNDNEPTHYGYIEIQKVDAESGAPIGPATFELRNKEDHLIDTFVTDETGYFKSGAIVVGDYILVETSAPKGYLLDPTPIEVKVEKDVTISISVENESLSLIINKEIAPDDEWQPGEKFTFEIIFENDEEEYDSIECSDDSITPESVIFENEKTGQKWIVELTEDGYRSVTFEKIPAGTKYSIKEILQTGYKLDAIIITPQNAAAVNITQGTANGQFDEESDELSVSVTYVNSRDYSGPKLPETGSMGLTILYIIGSLMLFGAGIVLVIRGKFYSGKKSGN